MTNDGQTPLVIRIRKVGSMGGTCDPDDDQPIRKIIRQPKNPKRYSKAISMSENASSSSSSSSSAAMEDALLFSNSAVREPTELVRRQQPPFCVDGNGIDPDEMLHTAKTSTRNSSGKRTYVENPKDMDILLFLSEKQWPGTKQYWMAIDEAKKSYRSNKTVYSTLEMLRCSRKILSQMRYQGRRFLKFDTKAWKHYEIVGLERRREIEQDFARSLLLSQQEEEDESRVLSNTSLANVEKEPTDLARRPVLDGASDEIGANDISPLDKKKQYIEKPMERDIILFLSGKQWRGTKQYWLALEGAKQVYCEKAMASKSERIPQLKRCGRMVLSQMNKEGRRFLRFDTSTWKYYAISPLDARLEIEQALVQSFIGEAGAYEQGNNDNNKMMTTIMEQEDLDSMTSSLGDGDNSTTWFFGDTDSSCEGGGSGWSTMEFIPFLNHVPMMFPYDEPTGISDHGWCSRSSSTIATLPSQIAVLLQQEVS